MGFIAKLFGREDRSNPMEDPTKPMAASALNAIFGWGFGGTPTAAGEVINEHVAMQHATVFGCVRILAEAVGSLTLRTYIRLDRGRSEATEDPIWKLLSIKPNDEMSAANLWECCVQNLALCGNAYIEILRNKDGDILQLQPLHPLKTEPVRLPSKKLAYRTWSGSNSGADTVIINAEDMLHFRLFSWDGLKGLSPIQQARQTIGWSSAAMKQSARFFGNGSKPAGILTPVGNVDETDLVNFRKAWELSNGGENQQRTAVLPSDWKFTAIGINPEDSQFLESMQFSRSDIATAIFRIPGHMVGDTSKMSNNNVQGMNLSFVIDTLRPYLVKIEQEICIKLFNANPNKFVEFDTTERLRGDFKSTMDGFAVGKQWGIITTNYCLEKLGENPIGPEGDIRWVPVNMQNADRLLDTESIQDQPVNADPNAPGIGDTKGMRSYFASYCSGFLSVYKDAIGRVTARSKRDVESVIPILSPVIQSITDLIEGEARTQFRLPAEWHASHKIQRDCIKTTASRADEWTQETKDAVASAELGKTVRSLYYAIYRDAGAAIADRSMHNAEDE